MLLITADVSFHEAVTTHHSLQVMESKYDMKYVSVLLTMMFMMIPAAEAKENPVEVGSVQWGRNFQEALEKSAQTGRPVLMLFQEVPGCIGCQDFGKTVLTSPLLVEAIEDEFLPVLVYNNRGGEDRKLLDRYNEPAWNYQVVRFLNANGDDIIPRKDRVWSVGGIASRMIEALRTANRPVPKYLETVAIENDPQNHAVGAFAQHCFWSGEANIGKVDGVISTEAGWFDNREVTRVVYNKKRLSLQSLATQARSTNSALCVYAPGSETSDLTGFSSGQLDKSYRKAKASDQKKQISRWRGAERIPGLTEMQKTKINAFITVSRAEALSWLSPRQRRALAEGR